jgi:hypothetical protein
MNWKNKLLTILIQTNKPRKKNEQNISNKKHENFYSCICGSFFLFLSESKF